MRQAGDSKGRLVASMLDFLRSYSLTADLPTSRSSSLLSLRLSLAAIFGVTADDAYLPDTLSGKSLLGLFNSEQKLALAFTYFIRSLGDHEQTINSIKPSPLLLADLQEIQEMLACGFGVKPKNILRGKSLLGIYDAAVALRDTPQHASVGEDDSSSSQQASQTTGGNQLEAPFAGSQYDNQRFDGGNATSNRMSPTSGETGIEYVQFVSQDGKPKSNQTPEPKALDTSGNTDSKTPCHTVVIDLTDYEEKPRHSLVIDLTADEPELRRSGINECPSAEQEPPMNAPQLKQEPRPNFDTMHNINFRGSGESEYQTPCTLRARSRDIPIKGEEGLWTGSQAIETFYTPRSLTTQISPTPTHSHRADTVAPFPAKHNPLDWRKRGEFPNSDDSNDGSQYHDDESDDGAVTPQIASSKQKAGPPVTKVLLRWQVHYFAMEKEINDNLHNTVIVHKGQSPGAFLVYNENQEDNDYQAEGETSWDDQVPETDRITGSYDLYLDRDEYVKNGPSERIVLQRFSNLNPGMPMLDFSVVSAPVSSKVRLTRRTKCGRANAVDIEFATCEDAHRFTVDLEMRVHQKNKNGVGGVRMLLDSSTAGGIGKGVATPKDMITMFTRGPNVPDVAEGLNNPCFCRICRPELHKVENSDSIRPSKSHPAIAKPAPAKRKTSNSGEGSSVRKRGRSRKMNRQRSMDLGNY